MGECVALFINTGNATLVINTLEEIGNPRPATPMQVNNPTCNNSMNRKIQQKRSKATDMSFYWVIDIVEKI